MQAVGVLALHGGVAEHVAALRAAGCTDVRLVRSAADTDGLAGIVLPGGESSAMETLLSHDPTLNDAISSWIRHGRPTLGTCAGLVLMARRGLRVDVVRNAYGSQLESCRVDVAMRLCDTEIVIPNAAFVRAPRIATLGDGVHAVAWRGKETVGVRQGALHAYTFHPELTECVEVHRLFLADCSNADSPMYGS